MNDEVKNSFIEIEEELINIITEMGYQKGRGNKFSVITAYIYVHGDVTQKILNESTGFSLSTISNALNTLEENGTIKKEYNIEDRQYHYSLKGSLQDVLGRNTGDAATYFSKINNKMEDVEEKLKDPSLHNKNGYENIAEFVHKMKILIPGFQNLIKNIPLPSPKSRNGGV